MDNREEAERIIKEAKLNLEWSKKALKTISREVSVHYAQLAIEKSAKALISCFTTFKWTHDPSEQINELIKEKKIGEEFNEFVECVRESSPWHGRSIYGARDEKTGKWKSPSEWCTQDVANNLIRLAEKSVNMVKSFIQDFFKNE